MDLRILPPDEILQARITLPLSKSVSNRALIISALTPGSPAPSAVAECRDTDAMLAALSSSSSEINIGAAGTAMRFLTAFFAAAPDHRGLTIILDGTERMRRRPIGPLVDALRALGAEIEYAGEEGFPPLRITGRELRGGKIDIPADVSSQYISALLMIAPVMTDGMTLTLTGRIMSEPYIRMTLAMMTRCGAEAEMRGNVITVAPRGYTPGASLPAEADWSAAAFWYEIDALTAGWVTLAGGLAPDSIQGDRAAAKLFERFGVTTSFDDLDDPEADAELSANPELAPRFDADLSANPDLAQALIVTAAMLGLPFNVSGLASLRIKETDRIEALRRELLKVGVVVEIEETGFADTADIVMSWDGTRRPIFELPVFDTYDDHRMAMALAPAAIYIPGIIIRQAEVVEKSYPGFWDDLRSAGFTLEEVEPQQTAD